MTKTDQVLRRAYAYCRASVDDDVSIEWQLADMRHYAENHGIEVVDLFQDMGSSCPQIERQAFDQMIEQACAGSKPIDLILADSLCRFGRCLSTELTAEHRLAKAGVQLITVVEGEIDIREAGTADAGGVSEN